MRFGVGIWADKPIEELVRLCERAEALGFDDVWFNDHYFVKDVYVVQALAALKTKDIRFGTSITSPYQRHPAQLASTVRTIHELSGGRAILGLGSGGFEYPENLATPIPKPLTACRETIDIVRGLWTYKPVSAGGEVFRIKDARLEFGEAANIPIYLGARGPRMHRLGGETCDGIIMHGATETHCRYVRDKVAEGAKRAGRDPGKVDICVLTDVVLTDDFEATMDHLRPRCLIMAGGEYSLEVLEHYGLTLEEVEPLRQAVREGDKKKALSLVTPAMANTFCIVGDASACLEKVRSLERAGLTHLIATAGLRQTADLTMRSMETYAECIVEPYRTASGEKR